MSEHGGLISRKAVPRTPSKVGDEPMEDSMTQQELAGQLGRLDPGAVLTMDESTLAKAFDARSIDYETLSKIEELAMKYGCSFSCHERGRVLPMFEKNDVF
jgi:hypothetical protein